MEKSSGDMLFPHVERDIKFADQAMSDFDFLKRCRRDDCSNVRQLLEEWFTHYPKSNAEDLRGRFQSEDQDAFRSSFWELYIHELLIKLGYSVEVHPVLNTEVDTRPDFLATSPKGHELIVEATSPKMKTEEPATATQMKEVVIDTINELDHPDFGLQLEEAGVRSWPEEPPSGSSVRSELERWLNSLDYNRLRSMFEESGFDDMPEKEFDLQGWEVRFTAIPRAEDKRGSDSRSIIKIRHSGAQWVDSSTPIRTKIRDKATRYGDIDRPYVIAINITDPMVDEIDIMDAIFGDEVLSYSVGEEGAKNMRMRRSPEGAWVYKESEINTRVSAVLIGADVKPWRVAVAPLVLVHNPWAQQDCKGAITQLTQYMARDDEMRKTDGLQPRTIFDLPASWPKAA